jgi:hypothetical protein
MLVMVMVVVGGGGRGGGEWVHARRPLPAATRQPNLTTALEDVVPCYSAGGAFKYKSPARMLD